MKKFVLFSFVLLAIASACSSSEADTANSDDPAFSEALDAGPFCDVYAQFPTDTPEAYVGSSEHLVDIDKLEAVAPDAIASELAVFRDYIASGVIDAVEDPASTTTENWPIDVQESVFTVLTFATTNC